MKKLLTTLIGLLWVALSLPALTITQTQTVKNVIVDNGILTPGEATAIFSPTAPQINLIAQYKEAKPGETVQVEWYAVDAVTTPNYLIASQSFTLNQKEGVVRAYLSRGPNPWPTGHYKAVLRGEHGVLTTILFEVRSASQTQDDTPVPPSPREQLRLVQSTVALLLEGLEKKDFSALYAGSADAMKAQVSPETFNSGLMPLTQVNVDWRKLLTQTPVIEKGGIDEENLLHLFTRYPSIDDKPDFHLHLVYAQEGGAWKLAGLWVE